MHVRTCNAYVLCCDCFLGFQFVQEQEIVCRMFVILISATSNSRKLNKYRHHNYKTSIDVHILLKHVLLLLSPSRRLLFRANMMRKALIASVATLDRAEGI